jgi:DNA repair protein RadD
VSALRSYQVQAMEQIDAAVATGSRAPLLVLPTGAGTTVIAANFIKQQIDRGKRCMFLAPRRELIGQASRTLMGLGIDHGVILAGADGHGGLYEQVQVASIDTLLSRMVRRKRLTLPDPHVIIVDEAHLSITKTRTALLSRWPDALKIGLTATPSRKDGRALGVLYDRLIEPVTVAELQCEGYLCKARYFSISEPDLKRVRTVAGDYHQGELEEAVNRPELVGDVVQTWLQRAAGRRTVVFATSIKHSITLAEEFLRAGVAAEHVDATTPQEMRDATFTRFRSGKTQVLTNCFLASYGFDLPELSAIILARPTKSLMLYLQMIGRGLRIADGKTDCFILDHSGAVHRHGFAHDPRPWTLGGEHALREVEHSPSQLRDLKKLTCPECKATFAGVRVCPECGFMLMPFGKTVKTMAGDLVEVGEGLEPVQLDQLAIYLELRGVCAERNWKKGAAAHMFLERFGSWPPRSWDRYPLATPTTATRGWLTSRMIAWRKSQAYAVGK